MSTPARGPPPAAPYLLGLQQQVQALRAEIDRLHERDDREMRDKEVRLEEAQQRIDDLRAVVNSLTEKCVAGKEQVRILTLQMNLQANEAVVVHKQTSHPKMGAASVLNGCPKMEEAKGGICLLIIDPQVDFHEDGALQVIGAGADSTRIKSILEKDGDKIDRVVVTLDTHHRMHIAHGCFWTNAEGESPKDFTKITAAEVESGKWTARQPEMREWALTYCKRLEEGDHFTHTIWPEHCLLGDPGHAVSPILLPALLNWSKTRERSITWVLKGQNNRTEMYSALMAEVEVDDDPTTKLNTGLIATLANHSLVIVCGEAKSHCVNYTLRDLLDGWPSNRKTEANVVLMSDGTSPVAGAEAAAEKLEADMKNHDSVLVAASTSYEFWQKFYFSDAWLVEAKAKLQVTLSEGEVSKYVPKTGPKPPKLMNEQHDKLYKSILKALAKEAKEYERVMKAATAEKQRAAARAAASTDAASTPNTDYEFEALREWNRERAKKELDDAIQDVLPIDVNTRPIAMFVVGHSASGKSTFVDKIFMPKQKGAFFYINPDVLGQYFCGSEENFVLMKKHGLMSGDEAALASAHADLNGLRFKFISQQTRQYRRNAVLDSNTVPPTAVRDWINADYDVRVAFVEASYRGQNAVTNESEKIDLKVAHGLANDEARKLAGKHSNANLINPVKLKAIRRAAAKLVRDLGIQVQVYISSGVPSKGVSGFLHLGQLNGRGLRLLEDSDENAEFGFLTKGEKPDGDW